MAKHAIKPPKNIDWWSLKYQTQPTLELSRRGVSSMNDEIAAKRILVALHEAAHFVVAAHDGLEVHTVEILGVNAKSTARMRGDVYYRMANTYLPIVRFHYAGALHEILMTGEITCSCVNDHLDAVGPLIRHCKEHGISVDGSHELTNQQYLEVGKILRRNWRLIRTLACAFLMHSDSKGYVDPGKTLTLYRHAQLELMQTNGGGCYENIIDDVLSEEEISRLGTQPENSVAAFQAKRLELEMRNPELYSFVQCLQ